MVRLKIGDGQKYNNPTWLKSSYVNTNALEIITECINIYHDDRAVALAPRKLSFICVIELETIH